MISIKDGSIEIVREETGDMGPIKKGDTVTVCMARGGCFDFQIGPEIHSVTVLHTPVDAGDLWYFRLDELEFAVNPCSSDFVGLILEVGEEAPSPPTRWVDWVGRWPVRIIGGDGD